MASFTKLPDATKNTIVDSVTSSFGASAVIKIYGGPILATFAEAISTQLLLSTHTCSVTVAPAASGGTVNLNAITDGTGSAAATGAGTTAVFGIVETSGGTRKLVFSVGATGCDLNMTPDALIKTGQLVKIDSFSLTSGN